ncbi:MAG: protoheme IX farnesyltransferase [Chloroflexi bacterium]|nr:protoheme IX farnesyltransferase [Chloroflexota bacterium]
MSDLHDMRILTIASGRTALLRDLTALTKPRQTLLLLITGICAYALTLPGAIRWGELGLGTLALLAAIAGCTALNMVVDRDIDVLMRRTARRPLAAGHLPLSVAVAFGVSLSTAGLVLAWALQPLFGLLVTAGFVLDFGVYTLWLKRRTAASILWGGLSGGMPALAGRSLALGHVDAIGVLLALAVLLWIPAHILSLSTRHADDYARAGVPVWPNVYGLHATYRLIAGATMLNVAVLQLAGFLLRLGPAVLAALGAFGAALLALALMAWARPSDGNTWRLFKFASVYMLVSFAALTLGATLG